MKACAPFYKAGYDSGILNSNCWVVKPNLLLLKYQNTQIKLSVQ